MAYLLNRVKDTPDSRDHLAAPPSIVLPSNVSLLPWLGAVKDQGELGSCTAHAGTSLREFLYRKLYRWEAFTPVTANNLRLSPLFQYQMEREIEGTFGTDAGAQSRTIFKAMAEYGCLQESEDPYVQSNVEKLEDMDPADLAKAMLFNKIAYHRALDVPTVKSVLASGYAVTVGTPLFMSFQSEVVARTGEVPVPIAGDTLDGGHEMLIYGYSDARAWFYVRNSWGDGWGDNGNCYIPYDYFSSPLVTAEGGADFWTAHLGKPWV